MDMKKIFYSIFFTAFCIIIAAACDSENEKEPEPPVDPVNPVEPIDTVVNDSVDADSFGIGPFVPYTGPIEPLSKEIRPILTDRKRWVSVRVLKNLYSEQIPDEQLDRFIFISSLIQGSSITEGFSTKILHWRLGKEAINVYDNNTNINHDIYREENGAIYKYCYIMGQEDQGPQFDLDLKIDSNQYENFWGIEIISKGTITLMGKERRAIKSRSHYPLYTKYDYWVEGIGSLFGYSKKHATALTTETHEPPKILQCYDGDELIYDYREFKPELYKEIEVFTDIDK